jgi:hypothetical protein
MTPATHLHLKRPTGWFAAGREIEQSLTLLSDASFKLFVWLCLHADRGRGSLTASPKQLASALHKTEPELQEALDELFQQGVCTSPADGVIEIADRFWPYQRSSNSVATEDLALYIAQVKRCFLKRPCVRSTFTPADEKLAAQLYRNGVPVVDVERAILLGSLRKYVALSNNRRGTPITTLHYFVALFDEVRQDTSPGYWTYLTQKLQNFEQHWNEPQTHLEQETK